MEKSFHNRETILFHNLADLAPNSLQIDYYEFVFAREEGRVGR